MVDDNPARPPDGQGRAAPEFDAAAWVGEPDNRTSDDFIVARAKVAFWMFVLLICGVASYVTVLLVFRIVQLLLRA
ncbi:hypothetical protein HNQ96_005193 [Aminobacter lissarensis]|uniref:Uncharacterized protein n=1 Tax=Aminobacter carboxidus TaxID=376165 RepID=A0A8E1WK09_9HYPH|nr:hypothetical protein [Aminobacter lissarensis]MBB6469304.1 hypothetical protein [Aminobacter lissarensis]